MGNLMPKPSSNVLSMPRKVAQADMRSAWKQVLVHELVLLVLLMLMVLSSRLLVRLMLMVL
jgi:hypothetical protein